MTQHHPSEATLVGYAAGSTVEGISLVIACHLAFCAACREAVAEAEAIGGGLLDDLVPAPLDASARDGVLARLAAPDALPPAGPRPADFDPGVPAPLARYVARHTARTTDRSLASLPWRRLWPGIRQIDLLSRNRRGANLRLLRIAPGGAMPHHGHSGAELTLVLEGSYADEIGRFTRGDVAEVDEEMMHRPIVDGPEECICLIATDAPLRFGGGLLGRILQRFVGL
jgi:putative transcriptional regulator